MLKDAMEQTHDLPSGLTETEQKLELFEAKIKEIDPHLSLVKPQQDNWRHMGVEVRYGQPSRFNTNQGTFRLLITVEEINQIVDAEILPEWFKLMIEQKLKELRQKQSALVDIRSERQPAQRYS